MLPRGARLPIREFWGSRSRKRKQTSPFFVIYTAQNGLLKNRIGVVIGKGVDRRSSRRHTIRRRAIGLLSALSPANKDVLVLVQQKAADLARKEFYRELERTIEQ